MNLDDIANAVSTREELEKFIGALKTDLSHHSSEWENITLYHFIDAMEAYVHAMDNYYKNTGQKVPKAPSWQMIADILLAGKVYE